MKTVEDAVRQENGAWKYDQYNAMAWFWDYGDITYLRIDGQGVLHHTHAGLPDDPTSKIWQLICTRNEFEAKAYEMGYTGNSANQVSKGD